MQPIRVNEWVVLNLNDGGKYGFDIQEGWINKAGEFKPNFCKREFGKKGEKTEKNVPVSLKVGPRSKAVEVLRAMLFELENVAMMKRDPVGHDNQRDDIDNDQVPF